MRNFPRFRPGSHGRPCSLGLAFHEFLVTDPVYCGAKRNSIPDGSEGSRRVEAIMKILKLKPEEFPVVVQLCSAGGTKEYVLVKTKQGKLLLNRPVEGVQSRK
jgi:hypothetical protein